MPTSEQIINHTKKWVTDVVIGCNFCPFANAVVKQEKVLYRVETSNEVEDCLVAVLEEATRLDNHQEYETTLLVLPNGFSAFDKYLDLLTMAEQMLKQKKYEGIYQLASFHPNYLFAGSEEDDPANYTNRSPYPMLHLLREESIDIALENYNDPENIPDRNVEYTRQKGLAYMEALRHACLQ
jgi:uncharacterized protein